MSIPPPFPLPLIALALAPAAASDGFDPALMGGAAMAQVTIHERIVIRVPRVDARAAKEADPHRWVEKKGPRCVAMDELIGAEVTASDQVDLMLSDGGRIRAKFDDKCPSLDFYSGFYLRRAADGMMCAGRDTFRSRSGGACPIAEIKGLRKRRWLDNLPLIRKR